MSADLIELAERCEAATGADTKLEREIAEALGWRHVRNKGPESEWFPYVWVAPDGKCDADETYPDYTASIDAALTLVPEGWNWQVGKGNHCWSAVYQGAPPSMRVDPIAATPALAICAAALRARAAQ